MEPLAIDYSTCRIARKKLYLFSRKQFAAGGAAGLAAAGAVGEAKELHAAIGPEAELLCSVFCFFW